MFTDCFLAKFASNIPSKFLRNQPIFPRICPKKSHEIWIFFRDLSEALPSKEIVLNISLTSLCSHLQLDNSSGCHQWHILRIHEHLLGGQTLNVLQWLKKREPLLSNRNFWGIIIGCFHMMSQWPYWCPKTMKWRWKFVPKRGGLLSNSPFNSWEIERRIYQFTKSHWWGSFIPGHPSIINISLRTVDVFPVVVRSNIVVGYWWSKFTRMAKEWNLGCMTEKKKRLPVRVEVARVRWPSSNIKLFMHRN